LSTGNLHWVVDPQYTEDGAAERLNLAAKPALACPFPLEFPVKGGGGQIGRIREDPHRDGDGVGVHLIGLKAGDASAPQVVAFGVVAGSPDQAIASLPVQGADLRMQQLAHRGPVSLFHGRDELIGAVCDNFAVGLKIPAQDTEQAGQQDRGCPAVHEPFLLAFVARPEKNAANEDQSDGQPPGRFIEICHDRLNLSHPKVR
jgi:hypothetical protein